MLVLYIKLPQKTILIELSFSSYPGAGFTKSHYLKNNHAAPDTRLLLLPYFFTPHTIYCIFVTFLYLILTTACCFNSLAFFLLNMTFSALKVIYGITFRVFYYDFSCILV